MMIKKIFSLFLAVVLVLTVVSCGEKGESPDKEKSPDKEVQDFCAAMEAFDIEKINTYLPSGEDVMDEMDVDENSPAWLIDYMKSWAGKMTYVVETPQIDGNTATVAVKFRFIDASSAFDNAISDYFLQALALAFTGATEDEMNELAETIFKENLEGTGAETAEETVVFTCTRGEGGWRITEIPDGIINILSGNVLASLGSLLND